MSSIPHVAGTGGSVVIQQCQNCGNKELVPILFLGYLPPVNKMVKIGSEIAEQPSYPARMMRCKKCELVQLELIVAPEILFPKEYPYTSSTTKILRDNFTQLYHELTSFHQLQAQDLVVDIGSNDGNLLSNFVGHCQVQGVTPEDIGKIAVERGIPTIFKYFGKEAVDEILTKKGKASIITATNVFAHIEHPHEVVTEILRLLDDKGMFISESHYLGGLVETLQYDTIYHEHLRYYSLTSISNLLRIHGLEVFKVTRIPTHGGSIRVYAAKPGAYPLENNVSALLKEEKNNLNQTNCFEKFAKDVVKSKTGLMKIIHELKCNNKNIVAIGAPSRGSTLVNYIGLDNGLIDAVLEVKGSYKIGNYLPGTLIPIEDETRLFDGRTDVAMLLSWHIADELMPKLKKFGYKGDFLIPLPEPKLVRSIDV